MQLGMIGLGRMGGNIVRRLMKHGHSGVVYDKDAKAVAALAADGAVGARDDNFHAFDSRQLSAGTTCAKPIKADFSAKEEP